MGIIRRTIRQVFGLEDDLQDLTSSLNMAIAERVAADGDLTELNTVTRNSLVAAINEAMTAAGDLESTALQIAQNLADLADVLSARTNLAVYAEQEVLDAITAAQLDLGTNYRVADLTERDALENLNTNDRVFVGDIGDGTWATYKPTTFEGGLATEWRMLSSQASLENTISADAIKTAYESNEDTNAFTDDHKAKVDFLTVTQAIDLDDAVLKAELEQDLEASAPAGNAASAAAVKAYVDEATRQGGPVPILETVTVVGSTITLTHAPRGGLGGILNQATVRYFFTSSDGVAAYDATLAATVNDNEFTVETDEEEEWDGFDVQVQYLYTQPAA